MLLSEGDGPVPSASNLQLSGLPEPCLDTGLPGQRPATQIELKEPSEAPQAMFKSEVPRLNFLPVATVVSPLKVTVPVPVDKVLVPPVAGSWWFRFPYRLVLP
mmetsp:Transcript_47641/g.96148  ORF Transcript_47641/g.96148 Transcript_47641/m.96148 type:complete len:103 (-) Transcript_47641:1236-1544(-)